MAPTIVIMAAGIGSRYGGLKQMDPVGPSGEFLIDYSVYDALRAGFDKVVFVIRRDIEDGFRSSIGAWVEKRAVTEYVFQELPDMPGRKKPWGTGEAVIICADAVDDPFAVINADDFYGAESYRVLADFLKDTANDDLKYCMVGVPLRNTLSDHGSVARGICEVGNDGCLRSVKEHLKITAADLPKFKGPGDPLVSVNMWGFKPSVFEYLRDEFEIFKKEASDLKSAEYLIPTVIDRLIAKQKVTVSVLRSPGSWLGITYPEDKAGVVEKIGKLVGKGLYPQNVRKESF